ncbi:MAG TPA: MFS transporter [Acidimicrobiales bacterium]|nr:MFS transporter [Acidimicrobiales bacterium]
MTTAQDPTVVGPAPSAAVRPSPWSPLRHRVFLALWSAQIASNIGSFMQNVGAAWVMGDLRSDPVFVALVQTAVTLPVFLLGLPAGALADIVDRRRLLISTQTAMLLAAASLAILQFLGATTPLSLLGLTFLLGCGGALNLPAYQAIQPELVPRQEFSQAVALGSVTFNLGRAVGPALGGLVIATAGAEWVFAVNALSFLAVIGVLLWWKRPAAPSGLPSESLAGAMRAGLRYSGNSMAMRAVLVRAALFAFPASAILALLPVVSRGPLGLGSGGYGLLLGCFGLGAAAIVAARPWLESKYSPDRLLGGCSLVLAVTLVVAGYVDGPLAVGVALLFGGAAWTTAMTTANISAQAALPAWVRARGMGLYMLVVSGSLAVGSLIWGAIAGWRVSGAHAVATAVLLGGLTTLRRWRVGTAMTLDLTVVPAADPQVAYQPEPTAGPVLVTIQYHVPAAEVASFTDDMRRVERWRRRTGAYRWGIFRDLADPERFLETFVVESWAEHLRQHQRKTAADQQVHELVARYVTGPAEHLISPYGSNSVDALPRPADAGEEDGADAFPDVQPAPREAGRPA